MGHRRNDRPDVPAGRGVRARPLMDALLLRPAPSISSPYFPVHKERMQQNFDIFDFTLTEQDMAAIKTLDTNKSLFFSHYDPATVEMITGLAR